MKLPVSPEAVAVVRERVHRSCAAAEAELAGASSGGLWQALATAADDLPDDGGLWGINIMFRAVILDAFEDTDSPLLSRCGAD